MIYNVERETMSQEDRVALQLESLQKTVKHVYENNTFHKNKLDEAGIKPENIKSLKDIEKLPFMKKSDLRDNYPKGLFAVPNEDIVRLHASSGTSGKPTIAAYTKNDIEMWAEVVARSIAAAGGEKQGIMHNAYGYGLFTGGLGIHHGGEKLGITTIPVSTGNTARQILVINDLKPDIICATPSYALHLADVMEAEGINPRETSLKYGIFGAEAWSEEMRSLIEERLNIKAVDIYGLSEVVGPGVSIECVEAQDGLHVQEDHFYPEIIDPDTLEVLPDGEYGELVFTSLTKEAFPVIRYRTGDISAIQRSTCECGRTTVRMSRAKGRVDDMLIIKGVNVFPSEVERSLLQISELTPNYQLHLTRSGYVDSVELQVEICEEIYEKTSRSLTDQLIHDIKKRAQTVIRNECLININIEIVKPQALPRSEGKAIRVVDKRKESAMK